MGCCQSYDLKEPDQTKREDPNLQFFEVDLGVDGLFERTISQESPRVRGGVTLTSMRKLNAKKTNGTQEPHASRSNPTR